MNKFLALQKNVFDISKITVVGNPSISDDGFISNCSGSNYAKINNPITSVNNKFQVDCTIPIGTGVPFVIYTGTTARMFFWRNANNKLRVVLRGIKTDLLDTTIDVPETSLNVKCIVENNTCLVNVNGETLINKTITASAFFEMLNSADYFTFGSDIGNNPFNQPLDLKTFKIYVDGQLVFQPVKPTYLLEKRKEGYDASKFTIYGTPTITDGIASNFNASNYLIANYKLDMLNSFKFSYEMPTIGYGYIIMIGNTWSGAIVFEVDPENNFICWVGGTSNKKVITTQATQKQIKNISIEHDGNGHYNIKSIVNNTLIEINHTSSTAIGTADATISLGKLSIDNNTPFTGAIDLPSTSITVKGTEVFTGAKEKFYMLRSLVDTRMDYTPLAWIGNESNCNMFIPLVTAGADIVEIEYEAQFTRLDVQQAEIKNGFPYFFVGCIANGVWYAGCTNYGNTTVQADKNWHKFKLVSYGNDNGFWLDGERIYQGGVTTAAFLSEGFSLWIGHGGSRTVYNRKKYVKVRVNGQLVYNLIPVLDKNSIPCMYDLVSKKYFKNEGTGQFTYSLGG